MRLTQILMRCFYKFLHRVIIPAIKSRANILKNQILLCNLPVLSVISLCFNVRFRGRILFTRRSGISANFCFYSYLVLLFFIYSIGFKIKQQTYTYPAARVDLHVPKMSIRFRLHCANFRPQLHWNRLDLKYTSNPTWIRSYRVDFDPTLGYILRILQHYRNQF